MPAAISVATMAGPTMAPTAKKPSTVFMKRVCDAVEAEMSPISASAPVLKTLMPRPPAASSATNAPNAWLTAKSRQLSAVERAGRG